MSYLNIPRLHFSGRFQADPSTINNNDSNFDPTVKLSNESPDPNNPLSNTSVYWNPNGTHNWKLVECRVRGAANSQGPFTAPSDDPIIGAKVLSSGRYPAKIVDLDPDNQSVSQIWGLQVQVSIPDPTDPTKVLASVTATMPPTAFGDLWNRVTNAPQLGNLTMSAAFQAVLQDVVWVNAGASNLLAALQRASPRTLSMRFIVDSFQSDANQENFTLGRIAGTIGPTLVGEAPRSTPRRMAPVEFWKHPPLIPPNLGGPPSILSTYGPVGVLWDVPRGKLVLDLGNCLPTSWITPPPSGPSVPNNGWPINPSILRVTIPGSSVNPNSPHVGLKSGSGLASGDAAGALVGTVDFTLSTYLTYAGVVEIAVPPGLASMVGKQPLTLTDATSSPVKAVEEDLLGRYADVDVPFFRLNPGDTGQVTLWATLFGKPWSGVTLGMELLPATQASNGPVNPPFAWQNGYPSEAVRLSSGGVTTGEDGTAKLTLMAGDPGTPRTYPDGQPGPDGQVYLVTGPWAHWGLIFLFPGAPINLLVFSGYSIPPKPNWDQHVGPILSNYARMFPYMKGIIDLGDYNTVVANADAIQGVLNLPATDPHHMPIVRDLSRNKLSMINKWFQTGMPKSPTSDNIA